MRRNQRKKEMDQRLLDALFAAEYEWKQIDSILNKSIEQSEGGFYQLQLAKAKYSFLLREARLRDVRAIYFR